MAEFEKAIPLDGSSSLFIHKRGFFKETPIQIGHQFGNAIWDRGRFICMTIDQAEQLQEALSVAIAEAKEDKDKDAT